MKKTICFDFDGVCAAYDKWQGVDIFGVPIQKTAQLTQILHKQGWRIILWTTRKITPKLETYLERHHFYFDSLNSTNHNPPDTSSKPIAELYIDDRAFWFDQNNPAGSCRKIQQLLKGRDSAYT